LKRKHDGKVWEVENNLDDSAIWTKNLEVTGNKQQIDTIDEANKRINIVWNGATKEIRAALLLEQKDWLKKRESNCSLETISKQTTDIVEKNAIQLNCMTEMTDKRTEVLKQKISSIVKNQTTEKSQDDPIVFPQGETKPAMSNASCSTSNIEIKLINVNSFKNTRKTAA
jgi:uncharacterized protein YecT (DUF1311 family)